MSRISLKAARINKNMTRSEVAEKLGVSEGTVQNWEAGRTFPKQPQIEALCKLYGVSYDDIRFTP